MRNNSIHLYNRDFNVREINDCSLLMSITGSSFSYAITDGQQRVKVLFDLQASADIAGDMAAHFEQHNYLGADFSTVKVAVAAENELLVPKELFDAAGNDWVKNYFTGTNGNLYSNKELFGFNPVFEVVPGIDQCLEETLNTGHDKFHCLSPMLKLVHKDGLYINFTANAAYCLFVKDDRIHFQNHFETASAEDFNYFLLLIADTLGINGDVPVFVTGIINEGDEKHLVLKKYFNEVAFILPKGFQQDDEVLENLPVHYFSALLALQLCE